MTGEIITLQQLVAWLDAFADTVHEHRDELSELDAAIGDADHGVNMDRGMTAVRAALHTPDGTPPATAGALFKLVGMTLVRTVGGASGPLFGTFFLRFGAAGPNDTEFTPAQLADAFHRGLDGVVARGKPVAGDKTMFDALSPAVEALESAVGAGEPLAEALTAAASAAEAGRDATEPMQARKGRASYLGERSIGHIDPGAASVVLLLRSTTTTLA